MEGNQAMGKESHTVGKRKKEKGEREREDFLGVPMVGAR